MKKLLTIAASMTIAALPAISCSDLNNEQSSINENIIISKRISKSDYSARFTDNDNKYILDSSLHLFEQLQRDKTLLDLIRNPTTNSDGTITYIDKPGAIRLLEVIDFEYAVNMDDLNHMISENVKAYTQGYDNYISNMNISSGAKVILKDIIKTKTKYNSLDSYPEYASLDSSERDKLHDVYDATSYARANSELDSVTFGAYIVGGIGLGAWIGAFFPWPGAPFLGAVIGAVVGAVLWVAIKG